MPSHTTVVTCHSMATTSLHIFLLSLVPFFITTTASSYKTDNGLKSMHFTLYMQDYYNKTDYMIYNGIGGPGLTEKSAPLGSIFGLKDSLTVTPNPTSEQLGTIEMSIITHTSDGMNGIMATQVNLNLKNGHRGSVSMAGVLPYNRSADIPVAGGTRDFLFVQGYATSSPYSSHGLDVVFKLEFHLFWPPYAQHKW